jgi:ABC-type antimicrobial peptide transport system permease subunit
MRGSLLTGIAGTVSGVVFVLWTSRLISQFLFGVLTWDPATYGAVVSLLIVVCLLAGFIPARRVKRVDPVEVLRSD